MPPLKKKRDSPLVAASSDSSVSDAGLDADYLARTSTVPGHIGDEEEEAEQSSQAKAEEKVVFPPQLVENALRPTFNAIFNGISKHRGDHWKLEPFEENALVVGWTPIVTYLLERLGNTEQTLLILAIGSTAAIVTGKLAQDATKLASSKASTKTPESVASAASSASVAAVNPSAQDGSFTMHDDV